MYDDGEMVILYKDSGEKAVNIDIHTGSRLSIHATAIGKAILSQMSDETVEEILREIDLDSLTENTINSEDELREELAEIRRTGIAFDREERVHGLNCVAVPIRKGDDVVGTISVSGPTSRLKGEYFEEELPRLLHDTANVIELNFRYKDSAMNV